MQERVKRLGEVPELTDFFFREELAYEPSLLVGKGMDASPDPPGAAGGSRSHRECEPFAAEPLEAELRPLAAELGLKAGQLFGSLRVAVTGRTVAPPSSRLWTCWADVHAAPYRSGVGSAEPRLWLSSHCPAAWMLVHLARGGSL